MPIDSRTDPHAHFVTTPLPSQLAKEKAAAKAKEAALHEGGVDRAAGDGKPNGICAHTSISRDSRRIASTARTVNSAAVIGASAPAPDPFMRAENEDDDGYDPYSDRPAENPFFERDPWD